MENKTIEEDVLTVEEAVVFLKVSKQTVWRLAKSGVIGRKLGGQWRFSKRQLINYLENGEQTDNEQGI